MKQLDWFWRDWGIHRDKYSAEVYTSVGLFGISRFGKAGFSRGRCREWELRIPLFGEWGVDFSTKGKDYLTLVNGPQYLKNLNWILDEFDSSFNDLAISSLKYHLNFSVCDTSDRRDVYMDLIERLDEAPPIFTEGELAILRPPGWERESDWEKRDGRTYLRESSPEQKVIYRTHREREDAYNERICQARHDFVDVIGGLWS